MILQMYIGDKLVDQTLLSHHAMQDTNLREAYVQGAINHLLEKWSDQINEHQLKPQFFINSKIENPSNQR